MNSYFLSVSLSCRCGSYEQILRIHVSSEDDLVFLHTLEVSEDEFQGLKAEQGILVDFSNFPGKIIGLLGKCIEARGRETPR